MLAELRLPRPEGEGQLDIVIKDTKSGKEVRIQANGMDFELLGKSEKSKFEWTSYRRYFNTLPAAVYGALDILLKQPGEDTVCVEAEKARIALGKILHDRVEEIVAEVDKQ